LSLVVRLVVLVMQVVAVLAVCVAPLQIRVVAEV
jgi:hypothetical protein